MPKALRTGSSVPFSAEVDALTHLAAVIHVSNVPIAPPRDGDARHGYAAEGTPEPRHSDAPRSPSRPANDGRKGEGNCSIAPRRGDGMQPVVAEHMRDEFQRRKYLPKGVIADAEAAGIGTERRHNRALAVSGEAAPLYGAATRRHPRLRVQMPGDLAVGPGRLVAKRDLADRDFARHHAAEVARQRRIVIARDPDPLAPHLHRCQRIAIAIRQPLVRVA